MELKEKILCTAKELFGENDYNNVSLRNIAEVLGISVGNLTYYYKKKEDLIEAVILEQHKEYKKPEVPVTLMDIHLFITHSIEYQKVNAYYFRHYTQMADACPKVYDLQIRVKRDKYQIWQECFRHMVHKGYFRPESLEGQYESLIHVLVAINIYWLPGFGEMIDIKANRGIAYCMWSMLYPILTQKGVAVFRNEIQPLLN